MKNEDLTLVSKLTGDFKKNLEKRNGFFLSYYVFPKILEWDLKIWSKEMELLDKGPKMLNSWSNYYQILTQLDSIFSFIETKSITDHQIDIYNFFAKLEEHAEKYKEHKVKVKEGDERYYLEHLLDNFYRNFFNNLDNYSGGLNIWDTCFPKEWKVRASTLSNSVFQRIAVVQFLNWVNDRIAHSKDKEFDKSLNEVTDELFPEAYPLWWSAVLMLTLSPYDQNNRMKYVIESKRIFGLGGRIRVLDGFDVDTPENWAKQSDQLKSLDREEKDKTIALVKSLQKIIPIFYHTFSNDNGLKMIEQLRSLEGKYDIKSGEESRRQLFMEILEELI